VPCQCSDRDSALSYSCWRKIHGTEPLGRDTPPSSQGRCPRLFRSPRLGACFPLLQGHATSHFASASSFARIICNCRLSPKTRSSLPTAVPPFCFFIDTLRQHVRWTRPSSPGVSCKITCQTQPGKPFSFPPLFSTHSPPPSGLSILLSRSTPTWMPFSLTHRLHVNRQLRRGGLNVFLSPFSFASHALGTVSFAVGAPLPR